MQEKKPQAGMELDSTETMKKQPRNVLRHAPPQDILEFSPTLTS